MIDPDLLAALSPVLSVLRALGVRHYVGGSIASSAHGIARASVDADVVAELRPAEDVILAKLEWYRRGNETSTRQWSDVMGVLAASGASLDRGYLERGARQLGVADLLARALEESSRD